MWRRTNSGARLLFLGKFANDMFQMEKAYKDLKAICDVPVIVNARGEQMKRSQQIFIELLM